MKRRPGKVAWSVLALASLCATARAEPPSPWSIAVVDARGPGVHPASAAAVTRQLYATVARLGYRAAPESRTAELSASLPPSGASPADLLAVATGAHVAHALGATLGARDGHYVVTVTLANADRSGPYSASTLADAETLEPAVDRMARALLPAVPPEATEPEPSRDGEAGVRLAIQTEGAIGIAEHSFYNQLFGARLDYGFGQDFALGAYVGYANLKGKDGRTSNVLPYLQLEYRLHWSRTSPVRIPLRFGTGYLPGNGPFLRLATGPSFPIGDSAHFGLDLIAPTVWIVRSSTVLSMDIAAEVAFDW